MIGLALEGGGIKGAYHVGAYFALKKCNIKFNCICGTSIGAFNAAMLASKKDKELLKLWQTFDAAKTFGLEEDFKELMTSKKLNFKLIGSSLKTIKTILATKGIVTDKLRELLETNIDEKKLRESNINFGCTAIRAKDLKPIRVYTKDIPKGKVEEYIMASCYLPIFKAEKIIDDNYYIDGGIYDNLPISMLVEDGCEEIYAIRLNSMGLIQKVNDHMINITYIAPKRPLGSILELNNDITRENILMGFYDTLRVIKKYDGYHYVFESKSEAYYKKIIRKIPDRELKRVKNFFSAKTNKELVIKSIEYILKKEGVSYYQLLAPKKIIKKIKNTYKDKHFIYEFIRNIKLPRLF